MLCSYLTNSETFSVPFFFMETWEGSSSWHDACSIRLDGVRGDGFRCSFLVVLHNPKHHIGVFHFHGCEFFMVKMLAGGN